MHWRSLRAQNLPVLLCGRKRVRRDKLFKRLRAQKVSEASFQKAIHVVSPSQQLKVLTHEIPCSEWFNLTLDVKRKWSNILLNKNRNPEIHMNNFLTNFECASIQIRWEFQPSFDHLMLPRN